MNNKDSQSDSGPQFYIRQLSSSVPLQGNKVIDYARYRWPNDTRLSDLNVETDTNIVK